MASREGLRGVDITGEMLDRAAEARIGRPLGLGVGLGEEDLRPVLDPRAIVATRTSPGGAAPDVVRGMSASCRAWAERIGAEARRRADAAAYAEAKLVSLAEAESLP